MRKEVIGRHTLYCGDCLEIMPALPARSIDIVLTDLPYLLINADWDKELDIESVIENIERLLSENSAFVFFGRGDSFYKWNVLANRFSKFKEEIIWNKKRNSIGTTAIKRLHETISIRMKDKRKINKSYVEFKKYIIENERLNYVFEYARQVQNLAKQNPNGVLTFLKTGDAPYDKICKNRKKRSFSYSS
jgi:site-specific DNA-methyltransferase (adenine-specific)